MTVLETRRVWCYFVDLGVDGLDIDQLRLVESCTA